MLNQMIPNNRNLFTHVANKLSFGNGIHQLRFNGIRIGASPVELKGGQPGTTNRSTPNCFHPGTFWGSLGWISAASSGSG
jgi:hypothetical protein